MIWMGKAFVSTIKPKLSGKESSVFHKIPDPEFGQN